DGIPRSIRRGSDRRAHTNRAAARTRELSTRVTGNRPAARDAGGRARAQRWPTTFLHPLGGSDAARDEATKRAVCNESSTRRGSVTIGELHKTPAGELECSVVGGPCGCVGCVAECAGDELSRELFGVDRIARHRELEQRAVFDAAANRGEA